jgi:hypothetical protein
MDTTNRHAEAVIALFNNGYSHADYYIVGRDIIISRPGSCTSELDIANAEVHECCILELRRFRVPEFPSWDDFEARDGDRVICEFRRNEAANQQIQPIAGEPGSG